MLRAFEVFLAIVETGQVTAAARTLGLTQSAASQHLASLERSFGASLLNRGAKPLAPTHAGEIVRRRAVRALSEVEDLRADLRRIGSAPTPTLRIAALASVATTLTPALSRLVIQTLGVPELSLSAGLATDHHAALTARRADMIITSEPLFDMTGFQSSLLLREPFLLVLPDSYAGPVDDLEALAQRLPLIRFAASTPVGRKTDQHLQRARLTLPRAMEADRSSMVVAGVAAGHGFALLTPTLLLDAVAEGMRPLIAPAPMPRLTRSVSLIYRDGEFADAAPQVAAVCAEALSAAIGALPRNAGADVEAPAG